MSLQGQKIGEHGDDNSPVPLMPDGRILASYFPCPRIVSRIFFSFSRKFTLALLALQVRSFVEIFMVMLNSLVAHDNEGDNEKV